MSVAISIKNIGKKFGKEWIFRKLNAEIQANQKLVILGGNGSGKSTLLQMISGFVSANEGDIQYVLGEEPLDKSNLKQSISFASPYLQLIEDFTLEEMVEHSCRLKHFRNTLSTQEFISAIELGSAKHKYLKQFSSGMKQRLKLGLAVLSDSPLLLLDEPVSNLDKKAIAWYKELIQNNSHNRTIIVCSNAISDEYFFCDSELDVMKFKSA